MRDYYNQRHGHQARQIDLPTLNRFVAASYGAMESEGWFSEVFGCTCVDICFFSMLDTRRMRKRTREDIRVLIDRHTHIPNMWPLKERFKEGVNEVTLFTMIEFLYDYVSQPKGGSHHSYNSCGHHWDTWVKAPGQARWRTEMNSFLRNYGEGFELSIGGEVQRIGNAGLAELMSETLTAAEGVADGAKVIRAVTKFRSGLSTRADQLDALRDLAAVHELHRPKLEAILTKKDENSLYQIANNYGIRHHNIHQLTDYGPEMVAWIFHTYLAACWLVLDLGKRVLAPPPELAP